MTPAFLRKNSRIFMALFGSLLMITFVVSLGNRGSGGGMFGGNPTVLGTLDGKPVTGADLVGAQNDLHIGNAFADKLSAERPKDDDYSPREKFLAPIERWLTPNSHALSLYLILHEARQYGVTVTNAEIDSHIRDANMTDDDLRDFLNSLGISQNQFRQALSDLLTVPKVAEFSLQGIIESRPQLLHDAVAANATASVQFIAIPTSLAGITAEPSAAALQRQFDLYKDRIAGAPAETEPPIDGHHYSFGYKYPDRVALEYIVVPAEDVAKTIPITTDDQVEALRQFNANPQAWQPAATQPNGPPAPPATFDAVRSQIVQSIRDDKTVAKINQIMAALRERLSRASGSSTQPAPGDYAAAAEAVGTQFGVRLPVVQVPGLISVHQLFNDYGTSIGRARVVIGQTPLYVAQLAFALPQFKNAGGAALFALNRNAPNAFDETGNAYLFRVSRADPSHSPADLNEVRDQIVRDLKRRAEYVAHVALGRTLAQRASIEGIAAVAREKTTPLQDAFQMRRLIASDRGTRPGTVNKDIGELPPFTDAVFAMALASAPPAQVTPVTIAADSTPTGTSAGATPASAPAVELPPDTFHATNWACSINVDATLTVYVAQLTQFQPAQEWLVRTEIGRIGANDRMSESRDVLTQWFNLQKLAARVGYVPKQPFATNDEQEQATGGL